jgi:hypothetical protein
MRYERPIQYTQAFPDRCVDHRDIVDALEASERQAQRCRARAAREATARTAEVRDLTRRVTVAAVLSLPVLFAAMASEVFKTDWVPGLLLNPAGGNSP